MLKTTSQLISHYKSIEEKQAELYSTMAKKHPLQADMLNNLAKDSIKYKDMAERAYREGVTDAFEVGFLANPIDPENYSLMELVGDLTEGIRAMIVNEETLIRFCMDAASNSSKLLPDVPETFDWLIKRKKRSIEKLKETA